VNRKLNNEYSLAKTPFQSDAKVAGKGLKFKRGIGHTLTPKYSQNVSMKYLEGIAAKTDLSSFSSMKRANITPSSALSDKM